jgi:ATP-binding cassette, subfamily B, beta-glucan exporter
MRFVRVYSRVLQLLWPERWLAVVLVIGNFAIAGITFLEPILFGRVIDVLTTSAERSAEQNWAETIRLIVLWSVVGAVGIVSSIFVALHADRMAHRRKLAAVAQYFEHVLSLQAAFHQREHSGRMLKVMLTGADYLFGLYLSFFREHLSTFVAVLVLMPIALYMNWKMALLLIALLGVFTVVNYVVIRKTWRAQARVEDYNSELAARAGDALSNVTLVQSFVRLAFEAQEISAVMQRLLAAQFPVLNLWALVTVLSRMASTITVIGIFLLGSYLHFRGEISVGEIVSFMGFATLLIVRLEQATGFITGQFFRLPGLADFFEILDTEAGVRDKPGAIVLGRVKGDVEFDGVTHAYDIGRPAVTDLMFSVSAGTSVALVGPTGSGKSTTMALMSRLWDPQSGAIRVDGHDIRDVTLESLRGNIGVVFQDSAVFNRSIAENIRIGRPEASQAEIEQAARLAQAHDFIVQQTQGYDTMVGERGVNLSGGERQRLAIARTLLKNPPILILDEATSALDTVTESHIQQALETLMRGRTTFIIAHRLSTVRKVDTILVLRQGRIVERGRFDELVARGELFAEFARGQNLELSTASRPAERARSG